jgi:hypothetical protein
MLLHLQDERSSSEAAWRAKQAAVQQVSTEPFMFFKHISRNAVHCVCSQVLATVCRRCILIVGLRKNVSTMQ